MSKKQICSLQPMQSSAGGFQKQTHWICFLKEKSLPFIHFIIFGCRTSDGGKVVGTIEVSVVKMGRLRMGKPTQHHDRCAGTKGRVPARCTNKLETISSASCLITITSVGYEISLFKAK